MADFLYRAAYQGMDSAHLCILQTCPYHWVLWRTSLPHLSVRGQNLSAEDERSEEISWYRRCEVDEQYA
jgi:hypothetical protein